MCLKKQVIVCPVCGREYLPEEVFMGEDFISKDIRAIVKDEDGKILNFEGTSISSPATVYQCDGCGNTFRITAKVDYKMDIVQDDFSEEYTSKYYRVSLAED